MIQVDKGKIKKRKELSDADRERLGSLYITLVSDASFCHETKAYGWGLWIKHGFPAKTIVASGGGVGLTSANDAELIGVKEGLKLISELDYKGKIVVVQCDNIYALEKANVELAKLRISGAKAAYVKHVKGHKGRISPRHSVNTSCDKLAGQEMRKHRETVK